MKKILVQLSILCLVFTFSLANVKINSIKNNTNSGIQIDLYNAQDQFEKSVNLMPGQSSYNLIIINKADKLGHLSITPVADGMPYAQPFTYQPMTNNMSVDLEIIMQNGRFFVVGTK